MLKERFRTTELWIADSLLCAVGDTFALEDGRVRVRENKSASSAARAEAALSGMYRRGALEADCA